MPVKKIVKKLKSPPKPHHSLGRLITVISGGVLLFLVAVYGLLYYPLIEKTNTTEFCISCHEMRDTVYQEYKESVHFKNSAGVRAGCPDCHVPKQFVPKMIAKVRAVKDVWHTLLGTIDTPEKFNAYRWKMANAVWDKMKATDSSTCRSCHSWDSMDLEEQDKLGRRKHKSAQEEGKTCIDCHKGLVHEYPEEPTKKEQAEKSQNGSVPDVSDSRQNDNS
ncbi:MAG: hypothetical protein Kow006_25260 [Gammaproteobacteria bacterium]